jgi:hypothetical protein
VRKVMWTSWILLALTIGMTGLLLTVHPENFYTGLLLVCITVLLTIRSFWQGYRSSHSQNQGDMPNTRQS